MTEQRSFEYIEARPVAGALGAEIVGEVADMLVRCETVRRVMCAAIIGDDLLISTRTQRGYGSAVHLLTKTLDGLA